MLSPYTSTDLLSDKLPYDDLIALIDGVQGFEKHTLQDSAGGLPSYGYSMGELSKPCVVIDGSIHNNHEWKSAYGVLEAMKVLADPSLWPSESEEVQRLRDKYRFYFIPVLSPDSYRDGKTTNDNGVLINRNFDFSWDNGDPSNRGAYPFSEPEAQNLRNVILSNKTAIYINNHTVGNPVDLMMIRPTRVVRVTQTVEKLINAVQATFDYTGKVVRYNSLLKASSSYNWAETQDGELSPAIASIVFEPGYGLDMPTLKSLAAYGMFNFISDMDKAFDSINDVINTNKKNRFFFSLPY